MPQVTLNDVPPGRRERNKQRTREALIEAALGLFEAKGYEQTAVHEITDAVDVSERTFFRYFASKEDMALSFVRDQMHAFTEALVARPAQEPPLVAMRNAQADMLTRTDDGLRIVRLIDSTPSLKAAHMRYVHEHGEEMVRALAAREGVDPETDARPLVLAAIFGALVFLGTRDWLTRENRSADAMIEAFDGYASQVTPALFGHWRPLLCCYGINAVEGPQPAGPPAYRHGRRR